MRARDVTSYDLRKPWNVNTGTEKDPYLVWIPGKEGKLDLVEDDDFPAEMLDRQYLTEVYKRYLATVRAGKPYTDWPEDLQILRVDIEDVHTAKHFNRTWVLEFEPTLAEMPQAEQELFLEGLTKTILEGNPVQRHQTNFTVLRATVDGNPIGAYSVFHT